jgi:asparagine synthase (glutamine-hydrolysing)
MIDRGQQTVVTEQRVKEMCRMLQHGGPDDEGIYSDESARLVLGNRRLALLDLSPAGHMPMIYANRYVITYNGELYNHGLLRQELIALGHAFQNHTDTEVILAAFAQWSSQSFVRLKGMYAFALWDQQEKELWLVRDPSGIKPLYYSMQQGKLVFASEVRAFPASGQTYSSHPSWPVMLMAYGHLPEPVTTFSEVLPLQKGCFLHYRYSTAQYQLQSFSHYSYSNHIKDAATAQQEVTRLLTSAVKSQLLADAPVGVFLSGGLDSAIIATLAAHNNTEALKTLSIYFEDPRFSEKQYQDLIIQQLHCRHQQYLLKQENFLQTFPDVLDAMDLPSCDGVNTWFISKYAKMQGLKAVLSGIGGDELFGGYPSFKRMQAAGMLQHLPDPAMKMGQQASSRELSRMAYLQLPGIKGLYLFLRGHFTPIEIARQLDMDEKEVWRQLEATPLFMDVQQLCPKNKASWLEFNLYMQNQLLRDADVMSMTHGLEIRVPFLDHDLIKAAFSIQAAVKYPAPLPKQLLINCFKNQLPDPIWNRPKMGFSFPFDDWLKESEMVKELLNQGHAASAKNYQAFMKGNLKWYKLMALVNLRRRGV